MSGRVSRDALKVGISGVRGIVGHALTPQIAAGFAQAFGTMVGRGPVVVGRDTRPSGAMLEHAVVCGLTSVGCRPLLAGIVPTPSLLHLTRERNASGGICITASHNSAPWNALKFVGRDGLFLKADAVQDLLDVYHQQEFPWVPESELRDAEEVTDAMLPHLAAVTKYVDVAAIRRRKFRVALDACNGAGAEVTATFLRDVLGCEVVTVHDERSGNFLREPEPTPENLGDVCALVRAHGCDIGFAQDPDADRIAMVDEHARPVGEDLSLAIAIDQVLSAHSFGPVVVNLSTSRRVTEIARKHGAKIVRCPIGEIHVSTAMLRCGAVAGGEPNGGVIIPAIHACRDSFAGMAIALELLASREISLSTWAQDVPEFHLAKEKITIRAEDAPLMLRRLRRAFSDKPLVLEDGVMVDLGDGWIHARASNTEPVLRVMAEAPTKDLAEDYLKQARQAIFT